jgi:hypothetical protein
MSESIDLRERVCNCIALANEAFVQEGHNTMLQRALDVTTGKSRMVVATEKIDSRKRQKAMLLIAAYCPMCGEQYESWEVRDASVMV